ncbi:hypothetical protein BC941DRAFT_414301 [Chlamydoabsidia padenii]|nr:hypothetical protein BC941DRAFT_414301 [Chlamydoabsidia padenii]
MGEDYENVEWNVHATSHLFTPRVDTPDPLSTFDTPYDTYQAPQPIISPSSTPINNTNNYNTTNITPTPFGCRIAKPMNIRISDAQKHSDGTQGAYVSYLVTTTTSVEIFSSTNPRPVRRRFHDFVWLYNALCLEYPACIVPPLPEKHRMEYIKGDRFSSHFIERRILCLQWFLDRLARHPILQQSQCTRLFLESSDFKNDKRAQSKNVPPSTTVLETLSDTLLNAFAKVKKPDERFTTIKDQIDKLEDNLNTVERLYTRISKRQQDLQQDYIGFGQSIQGLTVLESGIQQPLHQFAETTKSYARAMKLRSDQEEMLYLNQIHELLSYCRSAKMVLRERDQKQVDFEELSAYLQQTIQDKERINANNSNSNSGGGSLNFSEMVVDKINEVRGMDMERSRQEKLVRLELKIKELQDEVALTNDISRDFSEQVLDEFELFQQCKTNEIKRGLTAYVGSHVDFYQKGISIWEKILPTLEAIQVDPLPLENDGTSNSDDDYNQTLLTT